jgi:hypothetical protein
MRTRVIPLLLALSVVVAACGSDGADAEAPTSTTEPTTTTAPTTTTTAPPDTTTTTTNPPASPTAIDWDDRAMTVELGVGWTVSHCEGSAPLLCVARDGEVVGVIERFIADPHTYTVYDSEVDDALNLRAIASDFVDAFVADREAGCGQGYVVEPLEPEPFGWGGHSGLPYGFRGTAADGTPSEYQLQYSTISHGRLIFLVAAAYDEGGCPGKDDLTSFDTAGLEAFQPHLEALLANSPLPGGDPETGLSLPDGQNFAWILSLDGELMVDPARVLSGEEARLQAVADGVIPDGEDLPNDIYIHNPTEDRLRVRVADDAVWTVIVSGADGLTPTETDRETIVSILAGGDPGDIYGLTPEFMPFDLLVVDGEVVEISEVYLP